jgi:hypothetical protein
MRRHSASLALLFCTVLAAAPLHAESTAFASRLSDEERRASGVAKLTDEQVATLNNLVEREVRLARQGNVPAFASEFSLRRSAPERAKAGIDKLTPDERAKLDSLVAAAIAARPVEAVLETPRSHAEAVRGVAPKPIVHGHVSFTVGTAGNGRNFYGGSVYVEQTDPQKGYSIGVGYSEYRGKGLWLWDDYDYYGPYGYRYGYPYYHGPYLRDRRY